MGSAILEQAQAADVTALLNNIALVGEALSQKKAGAREQLIETARRLIAALETPVEAITWMAWAEPSRNTAARVAVDLRLFEHLADEGASAKSSIEVATKVGGDPVLIGRILRHLSAMHMVAEVEADRFAPTALSAALTVPRYRDGIPFCFDCAGPSFLKLPSYLSEKGYQNPEDSTDGPFQYGHNTKLSCKDWLAEHPVIQKAFNNHMAGYVEGQPRWMDHDFYPVKERLGTGLKGNSEVLIVDVGGSLGHDLVAFKAKHPELPGRLVLQDLPAVISQVGQIGPGIEPTIHDFLGPQPVKGARAYYLHSVLHDFTDAVCRDILRQLIPAMEKGYSKLLINEYVVPAIGASWKTTSLDWFMMALAASSERTEAQWRGLLQSVGLRVTGIWTKGPGVQSLIEAALDES